jgi:hypothetical protein
MVVVVVVVDGFHMAEEREIKDFVPVKERRSQCNVGDGGKT